VVTGISDADSSCEQEVTIRMEIAITGVKSLNLIIKKFSNLTSTSKIVHFLTNGKCTMPRMHITG
jgi:hypothetical protein